MKSVLRLVMIGLVVGLIAGMATTAGACTGITLKAQDGAVLFGRTMEWGAFDLNGRVVVIPRGVEFTGQTPDGKPGLRWKGRYGVVGIDMLEKEMLADGMNENGLVLGLLYHPGFAEYQTYEPDRASESLGPGDVAQFLLTTCENVQTVRAALPKIRVVPVVEPALGFPAPVHFLVTDPTGDCIVIEFLDGKTKIFEAPLGVLTNAPTYEWHMTNLRNYVNLSPVALPDRKIGHLDFKALGAGSGMIGLPGDFTPPSRFVRAVAFTATARKTPNGPETMYEMFRILDNFNVPLTPSEAEGAGEKGKGMRSSTIWTDVYDTKNKVIYYHTQNNRRVRKVDVSSLDFESMKGGITARPLDLKKVEDFEEVNPLSGK